MQLQLNSFGRWLITCGAATVAVTLQYGSHIGVLAALSITAAWVVHKEVRQ